MVDYVVICSGGNVQHVDPFEYVRCSGGTWTTVEYVPPFDVSQLDPAIISQAFGVGFMAVSFPIVFAIGVSTILNFIRGKP